MVVQKTHLHIRIEPELLDDLKKAAVVCKVPLSEWVRENLKEAAYLTDVHLRRGLKKNGRKTA